MSGTVSSYTVNLDCNIMMVMMGLLSNTFLLFLAYCIVYNHLILGGSSVLP